MDLCLHAVWLGAGISFAHGIAVVLWRLCSLQPCVNCLPDQARSCDFFVFALLCIVILGISSFSGTCLCLRPFTGNAVGMILW